MAPPARKGRGVVDDRERRYEGRDPGQMKPGDLVDLMVMTWVGNRQSRFPAEYQAIEVKLISKRGDEWLVNGPNGNQHVHQEDLRAQ